MKRSIKTQEHDRGLWHVYLERGEQHFIGVIRAKGARIAGEGCNGYDLYDGWTGYDPVNKVGEAQHFSTAKAFLRRRYEAQLKAPAAVAPPRGVGVPPPIINPDNITTYRSPKTGKYAWSEPYPEAIIQKSGPFWRYRIAGLAAHHADEPRLLKSKAVVDFTDGTNVCNRIALGTTLDIFFQDWCVYRGLSSPQEDYQWIWRFPNGLGLSVLIRRREDAIYAAMLKFYPLEEPSIALHQPSGLKFKIVKLPGFNRDDYINYWDNLGWPHETLAPDCLLAFLTRIKNVAGHDWEPDPFWDDQNRCALGGPKVREMFENIIKAGPYWLGGYHCWIATCYAIRYPEDLRGFTPVAAWSELNDGRCQQWLILAKDGKFYIDDGVRLPASSFANIVYGVAPVPVDSKIYPSHIFDWIFQTIIPQLHPHEQTRPAVHQ